MRYSKVKDYKGFDALVNDLSIPLMKSILPFNTYQVNMKTLKTILGKEWDRDS